MARLLKNVEPHSPFSWIWVWLSWLLLVALVSMVMTKGSGEGSSSGKVKGKKRKYGEGEPKKKGVSDKEKKKAEKEKKEAEMHKKKWVTSMQKKKSAICERQVDRVDIGPHLVIDTLNRLGLHAFYDPVKGYIPPLVIEFYTNMAVAEKKRVITSKVKGKKVEITPNRIADYLGYERPSNEAINFPKPGNETNFSVPTMVHGMFTDVNAYRGQFEMGLLNENYRFLNKIVKYNIYPRGNEKKPTDRGAELLFALMNDKVVMDVALFIYKQIVDFYRYSEPRSAMIYVHMITEMCLEQAGLKENSYQ